MSTSLHGSGNGYSTASTPLLSNRRRMSTILLSSPSSRQHEHLEQSQYAETHRDAKKLDTFQGVFVPTALNVLSILMFLRFGFILGQMGILGSLLLLMMSYTIDLLTTLSISAISTNGTVRGGGAYYMISRSLGPEFGGSIGLVFYIGQVLNSGLNVVGFIEPLLANLGLKNGFILQILPQGYWWEFMYSSFLLLLCICVSLVGSQLVTRAGSLLFALLLISTISIPISALLVKPFQVPEFDSHYSGPSWTTFKENLFPHFTRGAAGSLLKNKETFQDLFGIFFPATAGIFAGASMSGDLEQPSKSIPKGTLWGLLLTFCCYTLVILSLGVSVPRDLLHKDIQVIQSINLSGGLVLMGEFSTCLFSVIVGIVGAANVLQAIAKDSIFPGLSFFSKIDSRNNPVNAILFTWLLTQLCLFANINQIATFITMAFLMTFIVTNLACFLLKIASAPNFRPSFRFFDWYTAFWGGISCAIAMFIVDGTSATLVVVFLVSLFIFIHYVCPPKPWGDVSQSLIYHQVRKYLLRLRQDNVKYWRPQILLLVDSPRSSWNLIQFCNHLKKGGLYILGHVIVNDSFQTNYDEFRKQQFSWIKLRDVSKVKAFVQIGLGPTLPWGVRNVFLGSGLGNMKPNITVLGYLDIKRVESNLDNDTTNTNKPSEIINIDTLPTDNCRNEERITVQNWVQIIEDLVLMQANVAVAKGFQELKLPSHQSYKLRYEDREFIDLYPIQMSAQVFSKNGEKSALTTNFDTYTLILQLGAILTTVPDWKKSYRLRIVVFVEYREDMSNEKERIQSLLEVLRIRAEILVVCLGDLDTYNVIIKGGKKSFEKVNAILKMDEWWNQLVEIRKEKQIQKQHRSSINIPSITISEPHALSDIDLYQKRYKLAKLQKMGVSFSMTTNKLFTEDIDRAAASDSDIDDSDSVLSEGDLQRLQNSEVRKSRVLPVRSSSSYTDTVGAGTSFMSSSKYSNYQSENPLKQHPPQTSSSINIALPITKKNYRPNFSSEKIPRSKVIDDATGDEPSIMLVPEDDSTQGKASGKSIEPKHQSTAAPSSINLFTESTSKKYEFDAQDQGEAIDINDLSFNDLPARAQHLILNDLMKHISSHCPVIFSTLPAPIIGTHYNESDSKEYLENLQIWTDSLPPILLINSQSMTVTTAL